MGFLQTVRHPAWYHGHDASPPFFEGWYYKLVDRTEAHRFAIIPGIFKSRRERLEMRTRRTEVGLLRGPSRTDMGIRVPETLQAEVAVRLSSSNGDRTIFEGTGRNGGLEVAGEWEKLWS